MGREFGKTYALFMTAINHCLENNKTKLVIIGTMDFIKHYPNVIRKGRWYYYQAGDKLILLKPLVTKPKGYKTIKIERKLNPELVDRLVKEPPLNIAKYNIVWGKPFEWKTKK